MSGAFALEALLSAAGPQLGRDLETDQRALGVEFVAVARLLARRNGFFAFEGALHVFPSGSSAIQMGLERWNSPTLWRDAYKGLANGLIFFAEDIFGGQFCIGGGQYYAFEPETGERRAMGNSLEEWAWTLMNDYPYWTGHPLAREYQSVHGRLPLGSRLMPKVPFVLGGEYSVDNLYALDAVETMRLRGELATQIRDLPDGAKIKFQTSPSYE